MSRKPEKIVAYVRVSSPDQSVKRQRGDLADDVAQHGLTLIREFTDEGISASVFSTKIRDDYENLVDLIRSGAVDGQIIWVSEGSRLSRNVEQFAPLRGLCRSHGVRWFISNKRRVFDLNDDQDLVEVTEIIRAAEAEIIVLRGRIRSGVREALRENRPTGITPCGYVREYEIEGSRRRPVAQVPDPVTGPIVTEIATRYAAGESARAIGRDLDERGVPTPGRATRWLDTTIVKLACSEVYLGRRVYRGKQTALMGTHSGVWAALVDEGTHMMAVERRDTARKSYTPRQAYGAPRPRRLPCPPGAWVQV
jgi:DNA invertase Pin-like site-specific DNA recombinase